jgi:hypothetical protein
MFTDYQFEKALATRVVSVNQWPKNFAKKQCRLVAPISNQ